MELMLDKNDMVFSFLDAIEGVDLSGYVKQIRSNNTKSHDRGVLLRTALFGYMINRRSLDELEESCKTDVRFMMLSQNERPSHMAFQRLFSELTTTMEDIFFEISSHMAKDKMLCNLNVQYVDGTKIEANANKNSFVYKKRIINTRERLFEKITDLICKLYLEYRYNIPIKKEYDSISELLDDFYFEKDKLNRIKRKASDLFKLLNSAIERASRKIKSRSRTKI